MMRLFARADGFVGNVAGPAFHPIVYTEFARGPESLVEIRGNAKSRPKLFIERAQGGELRGMGGKFLAVVGKQKFLITCIPKPGELTLHHEARKLGHLEEPLRGLAEFGATGMLLHAHHASGISNQETLRGKGLDLRLREQIIDVPHGPVRI